MSRKPPYKLINLLTIVVLLTSVVLVFIGSLGWLAGIIVISLWLAITSLAVFRIQLNYFIPNTNKVVTSNKVVALTFDDGPVAQTQTILNILKRYNAAATFFVIGENCENSPEILKRIINEGHQLGNHSYSHMKQFPIFSPSKQKEDISKTTILIKKLAGVSSNIFRPPFGITNPRIAKVVNQLSLQPIGWSIRSLDTVSKSSERIVKRVLKKVAPGSIILMHDHPEYTPAALEQILQDMSADGYKFVTIEELLKEKE